MVTWLHSRLSSCHENGGQQLRAQHDASLQAAAHEHSAERRYGSSSFAARGAADFLPRAESLLPGASEAHVQCTALDVDSRVTRVSFECFTRHGVPYLPRSSATRKGSLPSSLLEKGARRVYLWATAARLMHKV